MSWVKIFESAEEAQDRMVDNQPVKISLKNKTLCGIRSGENIRIISNQCPHSGAPLNEGKVNHLGEIVCPLHNYRFNLKDGREANNQCDDLEIYPVSIKEDGVYLNL